MNDCQILIMVIFHESIRVWMDNWPGMTPLTRVGASCSIVIVPLFSSPSKYDLYIRKIGGLGYTKLPGWTGVNTQLYHRVKLHLSQNRMLSVSFINTLSTNMQEEFSNFIKHMSQAYPTPQFLNPCLGTELSNVLHCIWSSCAISLIRTQRLPW